jgi:hypothetical protein
MIMKGWVLLATFGRIHFSRVLGNLGRLGNHDTTLCLLCNY